MKVLFFRVLFLSAILAVPGLTGAVSDAHAAITPTLSHVTHPRIVPNGKSYSVCVTAAAEAGDYITVGFSAQYGKFPQPNVIYVSDGTNIVCSFYKSPKNLSLVGKTEVLLFTIVDNNTGVRGKPLTNSFTFKPPRYSS